MAKRKPSCRLHKPSGQAIVTLSGKMHYLGEDNSPASLQAYERLIADWETRGWQFAQCNAMKENDPGIGEGGKNRMICATNACFITMVGRAIGFVGIGRAKSRRA